MASGVYGHRILPKSYYELEADFAAVAFQCGVALLDRQLSSAELAKRASCEAGQVSNAQRMLKSDVFQSELARPQLAYPRVIL
jgi:hypothetical protein